MLKRLNSCLLLSLALGGSALAEGADSDRLAAVLAAQPPEVQARYQWRHPQETLTFFGITPGMTVIEALPSGSWYTKILLPYLGPQSGYIGADYARAMYPLFGFFSEERLREKDTWVVDFTAEASGWAGADGPKVAAFVPGSMPESMQGTADAVLFVRALHNLARFEGQGGFLMIGGASRPVSRIKLYFLQVQQTSSPCLSGFLFIADRATGLVGRCVLIRLRRHDAMAGIATWIASRMVRNPQS